MFNLRSTIFLILFGVTSISIMPACGLVDKMVQNFDQLSQFDEKCNELWSNYDAQLQRRADLIPNLVAVVKGSAAHEHSTLKDVIEARAQATQVHLNADDLTDPAKVEAFKKAQEGLTGALSKLMSIQEQYPTLQANTQFHDLSVEIEGTENRILQARRDYNSAVSQYNFELRRVSGQALTVVVGSKTFKPRVYFQADESAKVAPTVSFEAK